jgi:hypothetical protein
MEWRILEDIAETKKALDMIFFKNLFVEIVF